MGVSGPIAVRQVGGKQNRIGLAMKHASAYVLLSRDQGVALALQILRAVRW